MESNQRSGEQRTKTENVKRDETSWPESKTSMSDFMTVFAGRGSVVMAA